VAAAACWTGLSGAGGEWAEQRIEVFGEVVEDSTGVVGEADHADLERGQWSSGR
jgi:hypothetical protein